MGCVTVGTRLLHQVQKGGRRFRNPTPWQCHRCRNLYRENCCRKKVGWLFKKPVCPECGIELAEGGTSVSFVTGG